MSAPKPQRRRISTKAFTIGALSIALFIASGLSIWASSHPDGLEFVAESTGFGSAAQDSAVSGSPLAGYEVAVIDLPWLSVAVAGAVGCALIFGLAWLIGRVVTSPRDRP